MAAKPSVLIPVPAEIDWDNWAVDFDIESPAAIRLIAGHAIEAHGLPSYISPSVTTEQASLLYGQLRALHDHYIESAVTPAPSTPVLTAAGARLRARVIPQITSDIIQMLFDIEGTPDRDPAHQPRVLPPGTSRDAAQGRVLLGPPTPPAAVHSTGNVGASPNPLGSGPPPRPAPTPPTPPPPHNSQTHTTRDAAPQAGSGPGSTGDSSGRDTAAIAAGIVGGVLGSVASGGLGLMASAAKAGTSMLAPFTGAASNAGGAAPANSAPLRHFGHPDVPTPLGGSNVSLSGTESSLGSSVVGSVSGGTPATSTTTLSSAASDTSSMYSLRDLPASTIRQGLGEHVLPVAGITGLAGELGAVIYANATDDGRDPTTSGSPATTAPTAPRSNDVATQVSQKPQQSAAAHPSPGHTPAHAPLPSGPSSSAAAPGPLANPGHAGRPTPESPAREGLTQEEQLALKRLRGPGTQEVPPHNELDRAQQPQRALRRLATFGDNSITQPDTLDRLFIQIEAPVATIGNFFATYAPMIRNDTRARGIDITDANRSYTISTEWDMRDALGSLQDGGNPSFSAITWSGNHVGNDELNGNRTVAYADRRFSANLSAELSAYITNMQTDFKKFENVTQAIVQFANRTRALQIASHLTKQTVVFDNMAIYAKLFWFANMADMMADVGPARVPALTYAANYAGVQLNWTNAAEDVATIEQYTESVSRSAIQIIWDHGVVAEDLPLVYLLASSGSPWQPAAAGAMIWQTGLRWPSIPIHVLASIAAPAAGAAAPLLAIPAPGPITAATIHGFARRLAEARGEQADCQRGLYWATEQFGMSFAPGVVPRPPAPNDPAPPRQYHYMGPLMDMFAPTLPLPGDVSVAARLLNLVPRDHQIYDDEVGAFTRQEAPLRMRLIALYAGTLQAANNLLMIDMSIHRVDMLSYLSAGVACPAVLEQMLNILYCDARRNTGTEPGWITGARGAFAKLMGCAVPSGLMPDHYIYRPNTLAGDALVAYRDANPDHQVWGNKNFWGIDGWWQNRPCEWALPSDGLTLNVEAEVSCEGIDAHCGWFAHMGSSEYAAAAKRAKGTRWFRYIPYGMQVVNVITQTSRLAHPPLLVQRSPVRDQNIVQWADPVAYANVEYDDEAFIFRSGCYVSYSWQQSVLSSPAYGIDRITRRKLREMKNWHVRPPVRVGILTCHSQAKYEDSAQEAALFEDMGAFTLGSSAVGPSVPPPAKAAAQPATNPT